MFDDHDTLPTVFAWVFFVFLEIPRNLLATSNELPGDACHRTHFLVFSYELPGDGACFAKRRKLAWPVVPVLLAF